MPAPDRVPGTRACVVVTREGVKLYGNRAAFLSLARFMTWIAESDPAEHFECHTKWHLASEDFLHHGGPPNVGTLFAPELVDDFARETEDESGFELTFMAVHSTDLDELFEHVPAGVLPEGWGDSDE